MEIRKVIFDMVSFPHQLFRKPARFFPHKNDFFFFCDEVPPQKRGMQGGESGILCF